MNDYYTEGDYIIIGDINGGDGYNWEIIGVVYHPERDAYFLYTDAGCSCNFPYDAWNGDWHPGSEPVSQQEVIRRLYNLRTDYGNYRVEDFNDLAQKIREFDPLTLN